MKKARLDRRLPQKDAAKATGCNPVTLLAWEKGRVAPDVRSWAAILAFHELTIPGRSPRALVGVYAPHVRWQRASK